jgi:hypothetical protein
MFNLLTLQIKDECLNGEYGRHGVRHPAKLPAKLIAATNTHTKPPAILQKP